MDEFQNILRELISTERLKHPFYVGDIENNYRDDLKIRLQIYHDKLANLNTKGSLTDWIKNSLLQIQETNDAIISALDEYLRGSAGKAYDQIENLMNYPLIQDHINHLKFSLTAYSSGEAFSKSLFRVRASDKPVEEKDEIFHIPFNMRHLVRSQRYSIAGLPCLYLGTSLYVCWQEMGKPDLNKLYLSHFKLTKHEANNFKILDFAYSLETLKYQGIDEFFSNEVSEGRNKAYLIFWPILMACSYINGNHSANFVVEYVIPNLILQWISREIHQVSGIRYYSTKTKHLRYHEIGINVVIPASTEKYQSAGFCQKLNKVFKYSKPVAWQLLDTIPPDNAIQFATESNKIFLSRLDSQEDFEEKFIKQYKISKFYEMEQKLAKIFFL